MSDPAEPAADDTTRARLRVIMLSPPGAGKGTHSTFLSKRTGIRHISSGDLLRAEIARGSALGKQITTYTASGDLVPDEVIFDVLIPHITEAVRDTGGYLLDGFPRTLPQAHRAAEVGVELDISSTAVVYLTAPDEVLTERLLRRAEQEGRADDTAEVIAHRLAVFGELTKPLVDYYRGRGLLVEVDADRPEQEIQSELLDRVVGGSST